MLELINKERAKEGLQPLKADPDEAVVGRAHSKDMFEKVISPMWTWPEKRLSTGWEPHIWNSQPQAKISHSPRTLEIAHTNLMNSPGHRANIMNPAFKRVGIGIQDGGFYGLMISQEFRNWANSNSSGIIFLTVFLFSEKTLYEVGLEKIL